MNKKLIELLAIILITMTLAGCSSKHETSFTKLADGIYLLDSYTDYKVEEYLAENIKDVVSFDVWMTNNLTGGVPTGDIPEMGCSSFSVLDPSGNHLFGRNYDMPYPADSLIIRTYPKEGYSSIGIVDMLHINLGTHGDYTVESEEGKSLLMAAPWCICDGINEKGLGISVLELDNKHVVNDSSKPDLLMYSASRVILDKCASVEEAISLLGEYDIYSPRTNSYHFFVTDTSGRSVILEWIDGEMTVVEGPAVTNFLMATGGSDPDQRRTKIERNLNATDSMTTEDAMATLELVSRQTRWSAIYNLEDFSVNVCFNEDYENTYTYSGK